MFKKIVAITLLINMSLVAQANDIKEYKFIMQEYEPFNWTDGDTLKGGMLEVAKRVCLNMKITCRFESLPMKRVISMLEDGYTTAVLSLVENADRASFTTLSIPVVGSNMSYFGIIGTFKKVNSLNDLAGATVGTVSSSSAEKTVLAHQAKNWQTRSYWRNWNTDCA